MAILLNAIPKISIKHIRISQDDGKMMEVVPSSNYVTIKNNG